MEHKKENIPGRVRVGVAMTPEVTVRLSALADRGEEGALRAPYLNGGMFSLLPSPSSTEVVVRARFGLGVLSGVCSCSQACTEGAGDDET
jgi:hypothetical protein